jgi:hypothetical protein
MFKEKLLFGTKRLRKPSSNQYRLNGLERKILTRQRCYRSALDIVDGKKKFRFDDLPRAKRQLFKRWCEKNKDDANKTFKFLVLRFKKRLGNKLKEAARSWQVKTIWPKFTKRDREWHAMCRSAEKVVFSDTTFRH